MALLVVFFHESARYEFAVLLEDALHSCAVVKQLFDNSEHFVSVFKVRREQIDVQNDVHDRDVGRQPCLVFPLRGKDDQLQLAREHLVELLEDAVLGHGRVLLALALDDVVDAVEVLLEAGLVLAKLLITIFVELLRLPRHVHVVRLVVLQIIAGRLLEADHVLC